MTPSPSRSEDSASVPAAAAAGSRTAVDLGAAEARRALTRFGVFAGLATLAFAGPLIGLTRFAINDSLSSYVLLIPVVSAYLIWTRPERAALPQAAGSGWAVLPAVLGLGLVFFYWLGLRRRGLVPAEDYFCLMTTAYLGVLLAGAMAILGWSAIRAIGFPVAWMGFMIPLPTAAINALEVFFQHTSAEVAGMLFAISGTPVLQTGLAFKLPGLTIQVAQECSGIHSSLVLFITAVLAGHVLLPPGWRRLAFALAVIPLGILRNAIRILTITLLSVHVDPTIINSPLHHRGGPIFFVASLVPFFLLLLWLKSTGKRGSPTN